MRQHLYPKARHSHDAQPKIPPNASKYLIVVTRGAPATQSEFEAQPGKALVVHGEVNKKAEQEVEIKANALSELTLDAK